MKKNIRADFPILTTQVNGHPLVYLDNAATTQKPQQMVDAVVAFYTRYNANIHRGVHAIGEQATTLYEQARATVAQFINAVHSSEIIFTSGTTAGINMIASMVAPLLKSGAEILLTEGEHHANLLPWQRLAQVTGAQLRFIPVQQDGRLVLDDLFTLINKNTAVVALAAVSNVFGVHHNLQAIIAAAQKVGALTVVDAAQAVAHQKIDVQQLGCDFLVFSGHKVMGPTGIGVVYIKQALHNKLQPAVLGGGMVYEADMYDASWLAAPHKFEAGTPPIAQAIGLAAALDYLKNTINFDELRAHEAALCSRLIDSLQSVPGITVLGPIADIKQHGHIVTFVMQGFHPHDIATYLSNYGVCVRAGHHCAQPLAKKLGIPSSVRVSFYAYNTQEEVDYLVMLLENLAKNPL